MYVLGRGRNASVGPLGSVCQPRGDDEDHSIATPLQSQQQIGNVVLEQVIDIDTGQRNRAVRLRVGDDRVGSFATDLAHAENGSMSGMSPTPDALRHRSEPT